MSPLYTRLKRDKVLYNKTRKRIRDHLKAKPGDHFNSIKRELKIPQGTLAYHLHTLEREKHIKSMSSGMFRRFYPIEVGFPEEGTQMSASQKQIYDIVYCYPGIAQVEIAKRVGKTLSTVNYHINSLVDLGLVKLERKGNKSMCFAADNVSYTQQLETKKKKIENMEKNEK